MKSLVKIVQKRDNPELMCKEDRMHWDTPPLCYKFLLVAVSIRLEPRAILHSVQCKLAGLRSNRFIEVLLTHVAAAMHWRKTKLCWWSYAITKKVHELLSISYMRIFTKLDFRILWVWLMIAFALKSAKFQPSCIPISSLSLSWKVPNI